MCVCVSARLRTCTCNMYCVDMFAEAWVHSRLFILSYILVDLGREVDYRCIMQSVTDDIAKLILDV